MGAQMKKLAIAFMLAAALVPMIGGAGFAQEEMSKKEKAQLFREGAQLWPIYCAQCHSPRPPGDYASYQWDILMAHMRTLGNIPPGDANAILAYLKGGS
jgi:mono/diheme cytochrome c family protein